MKPVRQIATSPRLVITMVVILIAVLAGPFRTDELSWGARLLFWTLLIGLNMVKWQIWVARIGARAGDSWQASALVVLSGAILLNLTLPFEINLAYRLVGQTISIPWAPLFTMSFLISLGIGAAIAVAYRPAADPVAVAPAVVSDAAFVTTPAGGLALPDAPASGLAVPDVPASGLAVPDVPASGLAVRANVASLGDINAIVAEDHYLRLWLVDGRSPLVLYRFGDAVRELAGVDGLQVHRGSWVAAAAVTGAVRDGRRWRLLLASGDSVPVSESFLPDVRARGWLAQRNMPNGSVGRLKSAGAASRTAAPSGRR